MAIGVGVRVGGAVSVAVVASDDLGSADPQVIERASVLRLTRDGNASFAADDEERLPRWADGDEFGPGEAGEPGEPDGGALVSGFAPLVGHSDGIGVGERRYRPEDLLVGAVRCLLRQARPLLGGEAPEVSLAHPASWEREQIDALANALARAGVRARLMSDAEAASTWFESEIAEHTGQLVGTYHVDDDGVTVALVRSGVAAGKAFHFPAGPSSPTAALATALGAFGWLPENLDAAVITGDGVAAREPGLLHDISAAISGKLDVHCVIAPGLEQTIALGAAIRSTGFSGSSDHPGAVGLAPSYEVTDVMGVVVGRAGQAQAQAEPAAEAEAAGAAVALAVAEAPQAAAEELPARRSRLPRPLAGVAAAVILAALVAALLLML